jgi:hypothetical protein
MLRQVSSGQYLDAIRMAEKFILHVEVLFAAIDDIEWHFGRLGLKGSWDTYISCNKCVPRLLTLYLSLL